MINFKNLELKMHLRNLKITTLSMRIISDEIEFPLIEVTKKEFSSILSNEVITKKDIRIIFQNLSHLEIENLDQFTPFCSRLKNDQILKSSYLRKLILRSIQILEINILQLVWAHLEMALQDFWDREDKTLAFYSDLIGGKKISSYLGNISGRDSLDEALEHFLINRGSRLYPSIYFSYITELILHNPENLTAFKVWDIVKEATYTQESIGFFSTLILTKPFPSREHEITFFNKISIDQMKLPDVFSDLAKDAKLALQSWRNRQNLLLAFSKASGMEDRKEFWPKYSKTVLNVYFSPYPNNVVMMEFPDHYVIEFVVNGNACYFYPRDLNLNLKKSFDNKDGLKELKIAIEALIAACKRHPGYDETSLEKRSEYIKDKKVVQKDFRPDIKFGESHTPKYNWTQKFSSKLYEIGHYSQDANATNRYY